MPFYRPLNGRILTVISTFFAVLRTADKVFDGCGESAGKICLDLGMPTTKAGGGARSLTGTNGGSIGEGRRQAGDVGFKMGEGLNALELILSVRGLAA